MATAVKLFSVAKAGKLHNFHPVELKLKNLVFAKTTFIIVNPMIVASYLDRRATLYHISFTAQPFPIWLHELLMLCV